MGEQESLNDFLSISFHLTPGITASTDAAKIGVILEEEFGKDNVESVDLDLQGEEIVYKVKKPLLDDSREKQTFFQNLRKIFNKTEDFCPHFTQSH